MTKIFTWLLSMSIPVLFWVISVDVEANEIEIVAGGVEIEVIEVEPEGTEIEVVEVKPVWELEAHYSFEGDVNNSSGNVNHGTADGDLTYVEGLIGKAAQFDGVDDYIELPVGEQVPQTLIAWIKPDSSAGSEFMTVIDSDKCYYYGQGIEISYPNKNVEYFQLDTHNSFYETDKLVEWDKWQQVAVVYTEGNASFYHDGELIKSIDYTQQPLDGQNYTIGSHCTSDGGNFKGLVDEVRIYNTALTSSQINQIYWQKIPTDPDVEEPAFKVPETANVSVAYTEDELILSWPEIGGANNYILAVGIFSDELDTKIDLGNMTSFRFPLEHLGGYRFYVAILADDGDREEQIGDVFQVRSPNAFDLPPILFVESDGETIWVKWNAIEGAERYLLEYGTEPGSYEFTQTFEGDQFEGQPVINVALENVPTGPIFFVVRAEKGDEKGPWSNVAHFGHYQSSSDQEIKLENGAKILTTGTVSGEEVDIFFYPIATPPHIAEEILASYAFFSSKELTDTQVTIPLEDVFSANDIEVLHLQSEIGVSDPIPFELDTMNNTIIAKLHNNWTFLNIPDPLTGEEKTNNNLAVENSSNLIVVLSKKSGSDIGEDQYQNIQKIIEMPFFEQSSGTCWAAGAMMLRKGTYPASDGPISDRRIYQWMANMGIGIDDGLDILRYDSYVALIGNEVTFGRYFFYESVKNKIIDLIDQGLPVIFTRSGHIVLVVGYRYDNNGDLILIQNNSQGKMYEEEGYENALKENDWRQFIMLTWSKVAPHPERSLQTVGIPTYTHSAFGQIYFSGQTKDGNIGKAFLEFNESEEGDILGGKLGGDWMSALSAALQQNSTMKFLYTYRSIAKCRHHLVG